uniref:Uncharacterized protein n=1 Tax=Macaca mulatta TaxID=9544 RepID=A0A5F8AB40_MACMU
FGRSRCGVRRCLRVLHTLPWEPLSLSDTLRGGSEGGATLLEGEATGWVSVGSQRSKLQGLTALFVKSLFLSSTEGRTEAERAGLGQPVWHPRHGRHEQAAVRLRASLFSPIFLLTSLCPSPELKSISASGCSGSLWEAEAGGLLEPRSLRTVLAIWQNPVSTKNTKINWAWWHVPVVLAAWEAEVGGWLEPRRQRLQLAQIAPLHFSLGDREPDPVSKKKK